MLPGIENKENPTRRHYVCDSMDLKGTDGRSVPVCRMEFYDESGNEDWMPITYDEFCDAERRGESTTREFEAGE